jgi:hypothetical protein
MKKGLLILGFILLIVGILPIILEFIGFSAYAVFFYLGFFSLPFAGFVFSELMLILIVLGLILIIIGAIA